MENFASTLTAKPSRTQSKFSFDKPTDFEPARLTANAHLQTIIPFFLPTPGSPQNTARHIVDLTDDDKIVLHDDIPESWMPGDRVVLLVHGLGGSYQSPYMIRMANRLLLAGFRCFRMDMRGCGAGQQLAKGVFHAARFPDLLQAAKYVSRHCSDSPLSICGYSLGANLLLKMLVSMANSVPTNVDSGLAVGPPLSLSECCRHLQQGFSRHYDRFFVRRLWREFCQRQSSIPGASAIRTTKRPRTLEAFDNLVTAPLAGFDSSGSYYDFASAGIDLAGIRVPTAVLTAADDPIVPRQIFNDVDLGNNVQLFVTENGGHLGFFERTSNAQCRRWLDQQLERWLVQVDNFAK